MIGSGALAGATDVRILQGRVRARGLLVVARRLLAIGWLVCALLEWARLIGAYPAGGPFVWDLPQPQQVALAVFALLDTVAAVGLWLLAPWGLVVWAGSAIGRLALHTLFADRFGSGAVVIAVNLAALLAYGALHVIIARLVRRQDD